MKRRKEAQRVILAVDLKAQEPKLVERVWRALEPTLSAGNTIVEPVAILNREDAAMGNYFRNRIGALRLATERHLQSEMEKLGIENLAPAKVLFADGSSTQKAVQAMLGHAKKTQAGLIAVSSHSRTGVKRFFLGSFAETLALQSRTPIFVVNPSHKPSKAMSKTVLYPTDFSEGSKQGLESLCESLRGQKKKIVLFHQCRFPFEMYMGPMVGLTIPQSVVDDALREAAKQGKQWCQEVQAKGFACKFLMDQQSLTPAAGILRAAEKEKVGMVAMASGSSKAVSALLGSVTRQILRSSPRPVWVIHTPTAARVIRIVRLAERRPERPEDIPKHLAL